MTFSEMLRNGRIRKKLKQSELAELLNVSDKTISSWENGRSNPDITILKNISILLEIPIVDLINADYLNDNKDILSSSDSLNVDKIILRFKRKLIVSISMTFIVLIFPIIILLLQDYYGILAFSNNIINIPNYAEFHKTYSIIKIIISFISIIFILASVILAKFNIDDFKSEIININEREINCIYYKYINLYICILSSNVMIFALFLFANEIVGLMVGLIGYVVFVILNIYILKKYKETMDKKSKVNLILMINVTIISIVLYTIYSELSILIIGLYLLYHFTVLFLNN